MFYEKRIKALIIISLLLIESFVWIVNGPNDFWTLGFFDQSGGQISVENPESGGEEETPADDGTSGQNADEPGLNPGETVDNDGYPAPDNRDRTVALEEAAEKGLLILVNKENPIDKGYKPDDLTSIRYYVPDRSETTRYLRSEAAEAFHQLVERAAMDGVELKMTTAYRSYDFQKILYDSYVSREGEAAANKYSAKPGQSEHQTGLAADVSSPSVDYQLSNDYGRTAEGKWLAENAHRFGFIIRFPEGKEEITGYQYEPWHIRYVGRAAAKEIYERNLTLEEFLLLNGIE